MLHDDVHCLVYLTLSNRFIERQRMIARHGNLLPWDSKPSGARQYPLAPPKLCDSSATPPPNLSMMGGKVMLGRTLGIVCWLMQVTRSSTIEAEASPEGRQHTPPQTARNTAPSSGRPLLATATAAATTAVVVGSTATTPFHQDDDVAKVVCLCPCHR